MTSIIADYRIFEPTTQEDFTIRDELLTESLRADHRAPYPIALEYPLVLSKKVSERSLCLGLMTNEKEFSKTGSSASTAHIAAHANLWIRTFAPQNSTGFEIKMALVGNVATRPELRGHGIMRTLMAEVEARAVSQGADVVVLWSDLSEFYQRLGFVPAGKEIRLVLAANSRQSVTNIELWRPVGYENGTLSTVLLQRLLDLRTRQHQQPFYQIERSTAEFATLLQIPDTALFVGKSNHNDSNNSPDDIDFFMVIGKGADMQGVIHEWGAQDPNLIVSAAQQIMATNGLADIIMLVPGSVDPKCLAVLQSYSSRSEKHTMAWIKSICNPDKKPLIQYALDQGFIWGLDSI